MANPEHLKILEQGVESWNRWRAENPLVKPDLSLIHLKEKHLEGANFEETNFYEAYLYEPFLDGANLVGARFTAACLLLGHLNDSNLKQASFTYANLFGSRLRGANLTMATLWCTELLYTDLSGADFSNARIGRNTFGDNNLSEVKGLHTIKHIGPSSIGIDTIYKSRGNIPEVFLRGCGVPEDFITYMRSLTTKAIEFYSCFISYSSKDEEFAKRLYNDLQSEGVRCWFAPEDLKIGEKFRVRIDEAVRLHDKLLLVLSENSVASQWVEKEVETAFEKEGEQGKTVLFPVQLDDAVSGIKTGWAADIRRTRHTGDFREWKNHDSYKKAFERLMRDLKAGGGR